MDANSIFMNSLIIFGSPYFILFYFIFHFVQGKAPYLTTFLGPTLERWMLSEGGI